MAGIENEYVENGECSYVCGPFSEAYTHVIISQLVARACLVQFN